MYTELTTNDDYPKTLIIRNHENGMIWQIYHVKTQKEAGILSYNATMNGFEAITLEDYKPDLDQTWPNWRDSFTANKN